MSSLFKNINLCVLIAVMALAPLQSLHAALEMITMPHTGSHGAVVDQLYTSMNSDHCMQSCKDCAQRSCSENHICHNGQCSSVFIVVLFSNDYQSEAATQFISTAYTDRKIISPPSMLFRPPRA